jgi:hypothetical protein
MQDETKGTKQDPIKEVKVVPTVGTVKIEMSEPEDAEVLEDLEEKVHSRDTDIALHNAEPFSSNLPLDSNFKFIDDTFAALGKMSAIAKIVSQSKLSPLKTEADVTIAIITGNQYGFPLMTSIGNIYPISGRPALSTHLHRALILKHKIFFEYIYNFEPMFDYLAKVGEKIVVKGRGTASDKLDGTILSKTPVDHITKISFERIMKQPDGKYRTMKVVSEFKMSEAASAGLLDKDTWINFPARMLDARAFNIGARAIASDILLGIYSIGELAELEGIPYSISASHEEKILD